MTYYDIDGTIVATNISYKMMCGFIDIWKDKRDEECVVEFVERVNEGEGIECEIIELDELSLI